MWPNWIVQFSAGFSNFFIFCSKMLSMINFGIKQNYGFRRVKTEVEFQFAVPLAVGEGSLGNYQDGSEAMREELPAGSGSWWKFTSRSTTSASWILFGKQEEILNQSLCSQVVKHSAFHATSNALFRRQWLMGVNLNLKPALLSLCLRVSPSLLIRSARPDAQHLQKSWIVPKSLDLSTCHAARRILETPTNNRKAIDNNRQQYQQYEQWTLDLVYFLNVLFCIVLCGLLVFLLFLLL